MDWKVKTKNSWKNGIYNFDLVGDIHDVQAHAGIYKIWPHLSNKFNVIKFHCIGVTLNTFFDSNEI